MVLHPPPDLHLGNPRLGPPPQNQVYMYQINTLLYKHVMICFLILVFIEIVQLWNLVPILDIRKEVSLLYNFFYTEKQLPNNT